VADDPWQSIALVEGTALHIGYPWHFVSDIDGDWTRLRLIATGKWNCLGEYFVPCGPDGYPGLPFPADRLLISESPPGALVGKFGGSLAHRTEGTVFAIGERCFVAMPEKRPVTFSIAVNGAVPRKGNVLNELRLEIFGIVD
jgi:hypothetical protein